MGIKQDPFNQCNANIQLKNNSKMPKTIYAVLAGINGYHRKPLAGCLNDAIDVKSFLEGLVSSNQELDKLNCQLLLAPREDSFFKPIDSKTLEDAEIGVDDYLAPTRANILNAFKHFEQAQAGDICMFYYSGHGSFQDAPPEFWHMKSARQVETIIAVDSRLPNGQDIIDKELGYQIWSLMKDKKDVHFLAIMDCCHAGDNTRGDDEVVAREDIPNKNRLPLERYFGYEAGGNDFYQFATNTERINLSFGEHIHLAAASESESAKELLIAKKRRGVFTYNLLKTLKNGGTQLSYRELMEEINILVRNRVSQQNSQLSAYGLSEQQSFLGTKLLPPVREYAVYFNTARQQWMLNAGQMHGILATSEMGETTLELLKGGAQIGTAKVISSDVTTAVLAVEGVPDAAKDAVLIKGRVTSLAAPMLKIALDTALPTSVKDNLRQYIAQSALVDIVEHSAASHLVKPLAGSMTLVKRDSNIPLFKKQKNPSLFLEAVEAVAIWQALLKRDNPNTNIRREEIEVEIEIIEGQFITLDNIETLAAKSKLADPQKVSLAYHYSDEGPLQPAIRVRVAAKNKSWFTGGLYMSSKFGIHSFLSAQKISDEAGAAPFSLEIDGQEFFTIPIGMDETYHQYGITEVTDYIKIFVATKDFDLSKYEQGELPLDTMKVTRSSKSVGFQSGRSVKDISDWTTITIPVTINYPPLREGKKVTLQAGTIALNESTDLTVPTGFSGELMLASKDHVQRLLNLNQSLRGTSEENNKKINAALLPPSTLWGTAISEATILTRDTLGDNDTQISILELENVAGELDENQPLKLHLKNLLVDESVVSFAYHSASGFYIPLGVTDASGVMHIEKLPVATEGKIFNQGTINRGSIGTSIKLFLKKIIWNPLIGEQSLNKLHQCVQDEQKITRQMSIEKGYLDNPEIKEIALLIHGIIGTTEPMVDGFYHYSNLHQKFNAVLSYDYENLNTSIKDTAEDLHHRLQEAGLYDIDAPRLTIIAHSMGGLVSRYLIEKTYNRGYVKQLIQIGTPNGGSEIADVRKSVFSLLTLAMNGVSRLKPFLPNILHLAKGTSTNIFNTLNEMSPSSAFLTELNRNSSSIDTSNYYLIGGNTALIEVERKKQDPFWRIFLKGIVEKGHYLSLSHIIFDDLNNDMTVRNAQMKTIYSDEKRVSILPTDHISYFVDERVLKKIEEVVDADV